MGGEEDRMETESTLTAETPHGEPCPSTEELRLPLWLTKAEAEALISLCTTSRAAAGLLEHELLARLGEIYCTFGRNGS
jgi:hypothetical protein